MSRSLTAVLLVWSAGAMLNRCATGLAHQSHSSTSDVPVQTGSGLIPRDRIFERKVSTYVDPIASKLLPTQAADCGVGVPPASWQAQVINGQFVIPPWAGGDCISMSLKRRVPFVVRYTGTSMDSIVTIEFAGNRDGVYRILKETPGGLTLQECTYAAARFSPENGVMCSQWKDRGDLLAILAP